MSITAKVILCSQLADKGAPPIWTLQLRYPRFIHAEVKTHRVIRHGSEIEEFFTPGISVMDDEMLSRNASSSRAIPVNKMIEDIRLDPAMPVHWGRNQKGMQADVELTEEEIVKVKRMWRMASESAIAHAELLMEAGLHKQVANRVLEPFAHINVIVTATDWDNFFALRDHRDAQPEIRALARKMRDAMTDVYFDNKINIVEPGQWHLPYVRPSEQVLADTIKQKISAARCARVSYLTFDGKPSTVEEDVALYDKLIVMKPAHASPVEHQAMAHIGFPGEEYPRFANFKGWQSLRNAMEQRGEL